MGSRPYVSISFYFGNGDSYTYLKHRVPNEEGFEYHNRCQKQKILNVCFADDLIMFARGDVTFAKLTMEALEEFKYVSGLVPSIHISNTLIL